MKPPPITFKMNHGPRHLAGASLLALLAGCAIGPDFKPPEVQTPTTWLDTDPSGNVTIASHLVPSPVTTVAWWTAFNDPKLEELVRQAAAQNLTVLQAEARVRAARASKGVAVSGFFPSVNASSSYSYSSSPGHIGSKPIETPPRTSWKAGLDAVWELDIFGGTRRAIEAAEATVQNTIETRDNTLVTLVAEVGLNYIQLRSEQQLLNIAKTNLELQQHTANITRQRWEAGFAKELDYVTAKAAADSTRAQIPTTETAIRSSIYILSTLLARDPGALLTEMDVLTPVPKASDTIPTGLPADLLRRRPDIRAAEAQVHADTAEIGVAMSQWFPQFSLTGSFGFQGVSIGQMTQWASQTWAWGPSVNWPIFAAGRISSQIELQKATLQADLYAYRNTVLTALQEVESARIAFTNEQIRRDALRDVVADNQKAMDISLRLYTAGSTEFINVLNAELSLSSSQNQLAVSEAAVATNLVALFKALGGGWSEFPERDAALLEPDTSEKPRTQLPYRSPGPPHL